MSTAVSQEPMEIVQGWLERVYQRRLTQRYDAFALVVGDEGVGKSTLMLELIGRYQQLRDREPDDPVQSVLDRIVWSNRTEWEEMAAESPNRSVIAVPDAARVLHKRESMTGAQREIEKDILDIRAKEFLMLLGYQDWGVAASILQERRAHFTLRIPERGVVEGYGRSKLDDKLELGRDEWPEPDFVDSFPDLSERSPELWQRYEQIDIDKKEQRMAAAEQDDPKKAKRQAQARTALKAYHKTDMSYEQVASLIDYSKGWVGDRVRAYQRGDEDPFCDVDEVGPAPSGG